MLGSFCPIRRAWRFEQVDRCAPPNELCLSRGVQPYQLMVHRSKSPRSGVKAQLAIDWWKPLEQYVRLRASDLAETQSPVQRSRPVRVQRSQLNGDAASFGVRQ
jgi:hypothetical protein